MGTLKAGDVADFADSMAEAIEMAMDAEWRVMNGAGLPDTGKKDRRLLFAAIARGVLTYLKAHEADILTEITVDIGAGAASRPVTHVGFNYSGT